MPNNSKISLFSFTTTLLLAIILLFLFNFNFDVFKAGAAPPEVKGQGTAGFIAMWAGPQMPTIDNLTFDEPDYCSSPGGGIRWNNPDPLSQDGYRVQVDNNSNFGSPEVDSCPSGSGCGGGTSTAYTIAALPWNDIYYAKVMVWDTSGIPSVWRNLDNCIDNGSSGRCLTSSGNPKCATGQAHCWQTPPHAYPDVKPLGGTPACNPPLGYDFTWSPCKPGAGTEIQFTDRTNFTGGSSGQQWRWIFNDGKPNSALQNPLHTFDLEGIYNVVEGVRDDSTDGNYCEVAKTVNIQKPIPKWREVAPR